MIAERVGGVNFRNLNEVLNYYSEDITFLPLSTLRIPHSHFFPRASVPP
jgi:hypothetical protein